MQSHRGQGVSEYLKTHDEPSYSLVASEYYDPNLHPTCADFREASKKFVEDLLVSDKVQGRIADIGCGWSLLATLLRPASPDIELVLIDDSDEMLARNICTPVETRRANVQMAPFGDAEFDWIFAILGDPYNTLRTWKNIRKALRRGGRCIFIVPSFAWAQAFRTRSDRERRGFARFVMSTGREVYLPSLILPPSEQKSLIEEAGLHVDSMSHVPASCILKIRSPKIAKILSPDEPILDVYMTKKVN